MKNRKKIFILVFFQFLESCLDYLVPWMKHTEKLADFNWISLDCVPKWSEIDKSSRILMEKGMFDSQNHQSLFHTFDTLKNYMDEEKIAEFKNQKSKTPKSIATVWVEFFKAMKNLAIDVTPLERIVSYALSIPGNLQIITLFLLRFLFIENNTYCFNFRNQCAC